MKMRIETMQFREMACDKCGDVVYVKKRIAAKPQMLDD